MSRLHLIVCFLFGLSFSGWTQNKLGLYIKHGDEKYKAGDYVYAIDLYKKALEIDSNSLELLWKYAEALKSYKDYVKAEYYYLKIYSLDHPEDYPYALLNGAVMQKHNGKYAAAIRSFQSVADKHKKDPGSYLYRKATREVASCKWAKEAIEDTLDLIPFHLPESINTPDSEFGSTFLDETFIFSSLHADSTAKDEVIYATRYQTHLYGSVKENDTFQDPKRIEELVFEGMNSGNGSLSLDKKRFYFSLCKNDGYNYRCKIMVAQIVNGKWENIDSLGEIINYPEANTTMPHIARFMGKETLFFASDRPGGSGGLDIWYSHISDGNQYDPPINMENINSPDNELSPWMKEDSTFYFSSSWPNSFGGYDVFSTKFDKSFGDIVNAGIPVNSPANDMYFFEYHDTMFVTSNRVGVKFEKGPTCCSDIFAFTPPIPKKDTTTTTTTITTITTTVFENLPVTLYFHNDCPSPKTYDSTTRINYMNSYTDYRSLLETYKTEYAKNFQNEEVFSSHKRIEDFFTEKVDKGVKDLETFKSLLLVELRKGARLNVLVKGFASPLAPTGYNVRLTKRRIHSFVNYMLACDNGAFRPYLMGTSKDGGYLTISKEPFGEYRADKHTSDDFYDVKKSIYSPEAAIERKIEIQAVDYLEEDTLAHMTEIQPRVIDLGKLGVSSIFKQTIRLKNNGNIPLHFKAGLAENAYVSVQCPKIIEPQTEAVISIKGNRTLPKGLFYFPVRLYFNEFEKPLFISITGEGR